MEYLAQIRQRDDSLELTNGLAPFFDCLEIRKYTWNGFLKDVPGLIINLFPAVTGRAHVLVLDQPKERYFGVTIISKAMWQYEGFRNEVGVVFSDTHELEKGQSQMALMDAQSLVTSLQDLLYVKRASFHGTSAYADTDNVEVHVFANDFDQSCLPVHLQTVVMAMAIAAHM